VDRVSLLGLVERQPVKATVELIGSVLDAIRPGEQYLSPARGTKLVRSVSVE
jgi:hypothetical protein